MLSRQDLTLKDAINPVKHKYIVKLIVKNTENFSRKKRQQGSYRFYRPLDYHSPSYLQTGAFTSIVK